MQGNSVWAGLHASAGLLFVLAHEWGTGSGHEKEQ